LPLIVVTIVIAVIVANPGGVATRIRNLQFDTYQRLHTRTYANPAPQTHYSVRVLDLGRGSAAPYGVWPLSHTMWARLVDALDTAGASIVVLDAPLNAPDLASPQVFAHALPPGPRTDLARRILRALPSPDVSLATALGRTRAITAMTLSRGAAGKTGTVLPNMAAIAFDGAASARAGIPAVSHATLPLPRIAKASAGIGARNLLLGGDRTLRAMPLVFSLGGKLVPSLDGAVMHLLGAGHALRIGTREADLAGLGAHDVIARVGAGTLAVPVRKDGAMLVYFSGANSTRVISAADLAAGKYVAGSLAHTIVYVDKPGVIVQTPLGEEALGQAHAEAMENILLGTALHKADGLYGGLVFVAVIGIGMAFLAARFGLTWAGLLALGAIAAAQGFTWFLFTDSRTLFDSLNPSLALALAFIAAQAARSLEIARTRTMLRQAFSGALPKAAFDRIARTPSLLKIEGEARTITCLSCGVRGFAQLAVSFADDPAGFTRLMGAVMQPLIDTAIAHGAMVDSVTGGRFLAYWNVPLEDGEHAMHAVEAANRMTVALAEVNEALSRERRFDGTAYEPVGIGIGIATGEVVAGGFTAHGHTSYSVNGDPVDLAGRICAQSGAYGPAIIVADDTRRAAERGFAFLEVDFLAVGPRDETIKLYAMLGNPLVRASPKFRALATFHEHIFNSLRTQQWRKARQLIGQCRKLSGASQTLYDLHLARIAWFEQNPPGEDWDGAFRPVVK
jgi:adenylate cyclase